MIDFHSHVMPEVDDGSRSMDMTMDMINNSLEQGVEYICVTPHFITSEHEISHEEYLNRFNSLKSSLGSRINVIQGLEVYINPELPELYKESRIWGYNGKQYMLIELPMQHYPIYTDKIFYELRLLGVIPVLAHPERNLSIMKNPELLINIIEQGNLAQMNSGSLTGLYGTEVKKFAEKLISMNLIHIVGSDGHNNGKRNTDIKDGLERIKTLNSYLYKWISGNEMKIVNGIEVEVPDIISNKKKKSLFDFFRKK
ncbi:MAG: CpsB/CapC family capsule biosynthesis tyrosine phosphatase [Bacillota bacterium]|nr:CpsB/CapC family capsule biosynthesis tyrosine phosphatase [Bacillota bacterium]